MVNGSPIDGCCECSAVVLSISGHHFHVETPKSQSSPSESKRDAGGKDKPPDPAFDRLVYQRGRKKLNSKNHLEAQALHVALMERESKNGAEERGGGGFIPRSVNLRIFMTVHTENKKHARETERQT